MRAFMTEEQFNERKSQHESIRPWREVPVEVIYYIENVEEILTSNGKNATVVTLCDSSGERLKAFATSILARDLEGSTTGYFIKSLGLKASTKNKGQSYYRYELVKEADEEL